MKAEYLIGSHPLESGTVQDLMDFFAQMTPKTRRESHIRVCIGDEIQEVTTVQCSQSDQDESYVLRVCIK